MSSAGTPPSAGHGSVADEIAALAEALRVRGRGAAATAAQGFSSSGSFEQGQEGDEAQRSGGAEQGSAGDPAHTHPPGMDACEICPVCRAIAALHTVSPAAVTALADLVHQAEVTLRALATDLQTRQSHDSAPQREDIPVDDLADD